MSHYLDAARAPLEGASDHAVVAHLAVVRQIPAPHLRGCGGGIEGVLRGRKGGIKGVQRGCREGTERVQRGY